MKSLLFVDCVSIALLPVVYGLYDLGPVVAVPLLVLRYAYAVGRLGVTPHGRQADRLTDNIPVNTSYTSFV